MSQLADSNSLASRFQPKPIATLNTDRQLCVVRFSPDGAQLFAGGCDARVHRWDCSGDKPKDLPAWDNGGGWVQCAEFSPDGKTLFTADSWGMLQAWNPADEKPKPRWSRKDAHAGWIHGLAVSPDGEWLATACIYGTVRVWSAKDGKVKHTFAPEKPETEAFAVAFHPDGKSLLSGDVFGAVKQWDVGRSRIRKNSAGPKSNGRILTNSATAADGRILTNSATKKVREFDASSLFKEHRLQNVGGARVLCFDKDGKRLFVAGTQPKNGGNVQGIPTVLVFDWQTGKRTKTIEMGRTSDVYVCDLAWHPAGFLMAAISGNPGAGKIVLQRPEDEKPFFVTTKYANCHSLALHRGGKRFAVTSTNRGSNGNGRPLKGGKYMGNHSPVHVFDFA